MAVLALGIQFNAEFTRSRIRPTFVWEWILAVAVKAGKVSTLVAGPMNGGVESLKIKINAALIAVLEFQSSVAVFMAAQAALIKRVLTIAPVISSIILRVDRLDA
jgi:hypothetical protein